MLERLRNVDGLVPPLSNFFSNLNYLACLANCLKRLTPLYPKETVAKAIGRISVENDAHPDDSPTRASEFGDTSMADRASFRYRMLFVHAMRNYRKIPKKPTGRKLLAKPMFSADVAALGDLAQLAKRLDLGSPEIDATLRSRINSEPALETAHSSPVLTADGPGVPRRQRSGLPLVEAYNNDRHRISLNNLHNSSSEAGEGITSFFVRKSIYLSFFGSWNPDVSIGGIEDTVYRANQTTQTQDEETMDTSESGRPETEEARSGEQNPQPIIYGQQDMDTSGLTDAGPAEDPAEGRTGQPNLPDQQTPSAEADIEEVLEEEQRREVAAPESQPAGEYSQRVETESLRPEQTDAPGPISEEQAQIYFQQAQQDDLFAPATPDSEQPAQDWQRRQTQLEIEDILRTSPENVEPTDEADESLPIRQSPTSDDVARPVNEEGYGRAHASTAVPQPEQSVENLSGVNAGQKRQTQLEIGNILSSSSTNGGQTGQANNSITAQHGSTPERFDNLPTNPQNETHSRGPASSEDNNEVDSSGGEIPIVFLLQTAFRFFEPAQEYKHSEVEETAKEWMRKRHLLYHTDTRMVQPADCLASAIGNHTHILLVIPEKEVQIDDYFRGNARRFHEEALSRMKGKRLAMEKLKNPTRRKKPRG